MSDPREINLFEVQLKERDYPDVTDEQRKVLFEFGERFFDDTSLIGGFQGYEYDGSWQHIARSIVEFFNLPDKVKILDVGCAKGFFLYDLFKVNPSFELFGIDISEYAIKNAMPEIKDNLISASCTHLPYDDAMFDLVISTDTLHNLTEDDCRQAVREINRVGKKHRFNMVHSYRTEHEKQNLIKWESTIRLVRSVDEWKQLYREENYQGHYFWKIFI